MAAPTGQVPTLPQDVTSSKKQMGVAAFVFVAYFWVSGGMYGVEPLLKMAPPAYVFMTILLMPLVYCIPIALICTDLSIAYPFDGGFVAWIDLALGAVIGGHNAFWTWLGYCVDGAVYPVLAGHYVVRASGLDIEYIEAFAGSVVLVIFVIRLFHLDVLIKFSTALTIMSLVPAALYVGFAVPYAHPSDWLNTSGDFTCNTTDTHPHSSTAPTSKYGLSTTLPMNNVTLEPFPLLETCKIEPNWGTFLPYVIWCMSGFFSIGTLAGQVSNPRRSIPLALIFLIPIVVAELVVPLALSVSIDPDLKDYEPGHYAELAQQIAGVWLNVMITSAAITSLVGTCNAIVLVADEALQSFIVTHFPGPFQKAAVSSSKFHRWFMNADDRIAPVFAVINCGLIGAFIWIPYDVLIAADMVLMNFTVIFLFVAYVKLKWTQKQAEWMYGHSTLWAVLLLLMPLLITLGMTYYALVSSEAALGIPYFTAVSTSVFVGVGLIGHAVYYTWFRCCDKSSKTDTTDDALARQPLLSIN
eukprot:m.562600 g.562600  ORF g.562600 m.562600 type:complete len:526 (+) comp57807_c0_seq3:416-1993(+)